MSEMLQALLQDDVEKYLVSVEFYQDMLDRLQ